MTTTIKYPSGFLNFPKKLLYFNQNNIISPVLEVNLILNHLIPKGLQGAGPSLNMKFT